MEHINTGHRETKIWTDDFECDLCDKRSLVILLSMHDPFGSLNICGDCLAKMQQMLDAVLARRAEGKKNGN